MPFISRKWAHLSRGASALFGTEKALPVERIDRYAFYQRAEQAFAIVITGETAKYGNILLKKGVTPVF